MPQTEEHLDIVHLLGVEHGVVVITKVDLVSPERVREVRREVELLIAGTRLEGSPVVSVSSTTGFGLDELLAELAHQIRSIERARPPGLFRLPVDRAFVLRGHGVVVTGTALAGTIAVGAEVRILPGGASVRVRSVEVHDMPVAAAGWRQRVALNLVGAESAQIVRGHVIVDPALTLVTNRLDAYVEIRPAAGKGVASHARVRVHLGTAEVMAKLVLLEGTNVLAPKQCVFAQLALDRQLVALRGDRFILRAENAQGTLGGGEVVLPIAERHRRRDAELVARLNMIRGGTIGDAAVAVLELAREWGLPPAVVAERLNVIEADLREALAVELVPEATEDQVPSIGRITTNRVASAIVVFLKGSSGETWTTGAKWERTRARITTIIGSFHGSNPLLHGIEMEAVRAQLREEVDAKLFRVIVERLVDEGLVVRRESLLALPTHRVALAGAEGDLAGHVTEVLGRVGYTPPELTMLEVELGVERRRLTEVLTVLEDCGQVVRVGPELYYSADIVASARVALEQALRKRSQMTAAEFRDLLGISRKFSIALLQYFDRTGLTVRVGDSRKLRRDG
jgi:selenocysteine-specific elongation factor